LPAAAEFPSCSEQSEPLQAHSLTLVFQLTITGVIAGEGLDSLSQKEILALAISLEEEDERIYSDFGESLRENFLGTAQAFEEMRQEEIGHRRRLIALYKQKFGDHIPLIRRQHVRGFVQRKPIWLNTPLRLEQIRAQVSAMEVETRRFYERAAARAQDASIRQLLDDLAAEESAHVERAAELEQYRTQTRGPRRREQSQAAAVRVADCAAGPRGLDGWLGFHVGAGFCGRLCHQEHLGCFCRWPGCVAGGWHQHGLRRSALR